ncbi:MAG: hypothetical protein JXQ83_04650 [Candidatus Glassbacteria bacterium]|nr:hypothetical protein [Candidatus Glassbacteria bacterium]
MKLKNMLYSLAAGGSLALGGRWLYRRERTRRESLRRSHQLRRRIVAESVARLAEISAGGAPVREVYFFIWIVERVCIRHGIDFPGFAFDARKGMLFSSKLTGMLRMMISDGVLKLEEDRLLPGEKTESSLAEPDPRVLQVVEETVAQWKSDFPEERLVRFGQLFRQPD